MSLIIQNKNIMKISNNCLVMVFLLLITGCDNKDYTKESPFGNSVYIDAAKVKDIANFTFNNLKQDGQQQISAVLAYPAEQDIDVSFRTDPSLISYYNARLGNNYAMLDAKYYKFSTQHVVIPKGNVDSEMVTIEFSNLIDLDIDTSFLLLLEKHQEG